MEINSLYELIINGTNEQEIFTNNIDKQKKFYNDLVNIISNNIYNRKLYIIINFLIRNEQNKISKDFVENILQDLLTEEENIVSRLQIMNVFIENRIAISIENTNNIQIIINTLKKCLPNH